MKERLNTTRLEVGRMFAPPLFGGSERRFTWPLPEDIPAAQNGLREIGSPFVRAVTAQFRAWALFQEAVRLYVTDFAALAGKSASIQMENAKRERCPSLKFDHGEMQSSVELQKLVLEMAMSANKESFAYWNERIEEVLPIMLSWDFEGVAAFWEKQVAVLDVVVNKNPKELQAIRGKMGCKWDDTKRFRVVNETARCVLYQVLPLREGVQIRERGKPVIHFAPLILQTVILDLLPYEGLSYIGAFADSGTPTFFMVTKEIVSTPEAQVLTEEQLILDLEFFAQSLSRSYGRKVTLNGTCQGALPLLHAVCAKGRRIDKYVDCWIGLVPAYSLYASPRVRADMAKIPESKRNDLNAITVVLGNGNRVVPGEIAGFATRLKTDPWTALVRDMRSAEKGERSLMASAITEYLRTLIPMSVPMMEMSHTCASRPITEDGVFPTRLFDDEVAFAVAIARGIKLHVVAGEKDEVVDLEAALRMFELPCVKSYRGASSKVVPGAGHIALMTTCARDSSKNFIGNEGGPLWFHLQLEAGAKKARPSKYR